MSATEQLITVLPDGTITGLQVKPGKGLDLRDFGHAEISRASEIVFDDGSQRWYVQLATGKFRGLEISLKNTFKLIAPADEELVVVRAIEIAGLLTKHAGDYDVDAPDDKPFLFERYDDAVAFEVDFLNLMRENDPHCLTCQ